MKLSLSFLLILQLFVSTLFCSQNGSRSSSALSFTGSDEDHEEAGAAQKERHCLSAHDSENEEESEPLPTIMALLKLPEKKFHETFNKLSAPTSEKLLQKIKTHLDQQYEKVTNSKKKFEKSKALMETKKTPFELLNLHVDEQAAVVVAAQKKLEELEERRIAAKEIFEGMKLKAQEDCKTAKEQINSYQAAVNLQQRMHDIVYARAKDATPLLMLANQIKEKEAADKAAHEERKRRIEEKRKSPVVTDKGSAEKPNSFPAGAAAEAGWFDGVGPRLGNIGSALVAGGRIIGGAITDIVSNK